MKVSTFGKTVAAGLGVTVLAAGLLSASAQADPPPAGQLAGAGSDTTQDVVQGLAADSGGLLESWNAAPGIHEDINPKGLLNEEEEPLLVTRPNGSSEGVAALRRSLGGNVSTSWATNPVPLGSNVFDFARSSSAPTPAQVSATGPIVYVPFAVDRVQYATHVSSSAPTNLTTTNLQQLYSTGSTTVGGNTLTATTWNGSSAVIGDVTLYIPQEGSGTRSFWASSMGISATSLPAWVFDRYSPSTGLPTKLTTGTPAQEHDGAVLAADLNGTDVAIEPYSASQWTAQENSDETGVIDRRNGALLRGTAISREVFNVVSYAAVTNPASPVFEAFNQAATGGAEACDSTIIELFGFQTTTDCGEIREDHRVVLVP